MPRKRTLPPPESLPAIFSVRTEEAIENNKIERDAWTLFLKWCHQVPDGTKVELLRAGKVCAWLMSAGTRARAGVESRHATPPPILA